MIHNNTEAHVAFFYLVDPVVNFGDVRSTPTASPKFTTGLTSILFIATISLMLMIRLQRTGRKNEATFRVVLTDSKNGPKSGKFLEILGNYNPKAKAFSVNAEKVKHWISKGAKASDTIHNFLVKEKIVEGKKRNVLSKKSPTKKRKELKAA